MREHEGSHRKGNSSKAVDAEWRKDRLVKKKRPKRARKFAPRPQSQSGGRQSEQNTLNFRSKKTSDDREKTNAVEFAQKKLRERTLRPQGAAALLKTLSRSEKGRKPDKKGDKCIALTQGCKTYSSLCMWEPCVFENEVFENAGGVTWYIMRRTDYAMLADRRLGKFFAVLHTDAFLVPASFSEEWDRHYLPNTGVYVLQSEDNGDIYVGSSQNIRDRIQYHNTGRGATFTNGRKWFRIAPALGPEHVEHGGTYTHESQEILAQAAIAYKSGKNIKVRGGFKTK